MSAADDEPTLPQPATPAGTEAEQCNICAEDSHYFGIGACDHPVCGTCTIRLRVQYKQEWCTVCRADLKEVAVVVGTAAKFASLDRGALQHIADWKMHAHADFAAASRKWRECGATHLPAVRHSTDFLVPNCPFTAARTFFRQVRLSGVCPGPAHDQESEAALQQRARLELLRHLHQ